MTIDRILEEYSLNQEAGEDIWSAQELYEKREYLGILHALHVLTEPLPIGETMRHIFGSVSDEQLNEDYHKLQRSLKAFGKGELTAAYAILGYKESFF